MNRIKKDGAVEYLDLRGLSLKEQGRAVNKYLARRQMKGYIIPLIVSGLLIDCLIAASVIVAKLHRTESAAISATSKGASE